MVHPVGNVYSPPAASSAGISRQVALVETASIPVYAKRCLCLLLAWLDLFSYYYPCTTRPPRRTYPPLNFLLSFFPQLYIWKLNWYKVNLIKFLFLSNCANETPHTDLEKILLFSLQSVDGDNESDHKCWTPWSKRRGPTRT